MTPSGYGIGAFLPCAASFFGASHCFAHGEVLAAVVMLLLGFFLIPRTR